MPDDPAPAPAAEAPAQELPKPRPAGEPENVVAVREMIEGKLATLGGYLVDNHGNYVLGLQTARTFVVPTWLENGATVVRVFAITNLAVPVTAELTQWLLEKNLEFVFGAFALDVENGAIWFNHNLLGQFAAPEELEATIAAVIETANRFDDEIKSRFGGRLYVEGAEDSVPPPAAPGYL
ncbi:MAG TPA: YbjN domain-containing protein [Actinomycetota bacterium]|nr:YbjN domain-containing protein [Actinomycetota bacterium]